MRSVEQAVGGQNISAVFPYWLVTALISLAYFGLMIWLFALVERRLRTTGTARLAKI
jgi:hypothetical protein